MSGILFVRNFFQAVHQDKMSYIKNGKLSSREVAILRLVVQAKCRKHIADELNLSIHTVDTHLRHIHLKTNTHSLPELVLWALNVDQELTAVN